MMPSRNTVSLKRYSCICFMGLICFFFMIDHLTTYISLIKNHIIAVYQIIFRPIFCFTVHAVFITDAEIHIIIQLHLNNHFSFNLGNNSLLFTFSRRKRLSVTVKISNDYYNAYENDMIVTIIMILKISHLIPWNHVT